MYLDKINRLCIRKVLSKLNFTLSDEVIREVVTAKPGVIEKVLLMLRLKLERAEWELTKQPQQSKVKAKGGRRGAESDKPEADQYMGRYSGGSFLGRFIGRYNGWGNVKERRVVYG